MTTRTTRILLSVALLAHGVAACGVGSAGTGELTIAIQAEDSITEGLAAGSGEEDLVDGWSVHFDRYVASFGDISLVPMRGGTPVVLAADLVVDLTTVPETGRIVHTGSLAEGRYAFSYAMPVVTAGQTRDASVSEEDFERMVREGCSYLIVGSAADGARRVDFDLCLDARAEYDCASTEGMEGIVVSAGATTAFLTVHGDHLFFNGFPSGDEGTIVRRGGLLALVDDATGGDGLVDRDDLAASPIALLPRSEYVLTGAPTVEGRVITDLALYARAQLSTQGHLDGEGECVPNAAERNL